MSVYSKILAPVDGSPTSKRGLAEAIALAKDQGATLQIVHVLDELLVAPGAEAAIYLESTVQQLRAAGEEIAAEGLAQAQSAGVQAQSVVLETMGGRAADSIVKQARDWGADLIVLGTHGRRGVRRLLMGSDAEEVVRTATVPVLLVGAEAAAHDQTKP